MIAFLAKVKREGVRVSYAEYCDCFVSILYCGVQFEILLGCLRNSVKVTNNVIPICASPNANYGSNVILRFDLSFDTSSIAKIKKKLK